MFEHLDTISFVIAWYLAGVVHGISGVGGSMVAVPIISFFLPPQIITPVACLISIAMSINLAWTFRADCCYNAIKYIAMGAFVGCFVGLLILLFIPTHIILMLTGTVMLLFVFWRANSAKLTRSFPETNFKSSTAGFFGGVLSSAVSFGNPPIAVYALHVGWTQLQSLGTLAMFGSLVTLMTCSMQAAAGLLTHEVFAWTAIGIPSALVGILSVMPIVRKINHIVFAKILLLIIGAGGATCVFRGIKGFIV